MDSLEQKAIDYSLGILPKEDSKLFEALLEKDEDALRALKNAREDLSLVGLSSKSSRLSEDMRSRILDLSKSEQTVVSEPDEKTLQAIRKSIEQPSQRYNGGGGSVDLSDISESRFQDTIKFLYEKMLLLSPLIAGDSEAAEGDLRTLTSTSAKLSKELSEKIDFQSIGPENLPNDMPSHSVRRSIITSFPSLSFFIERVSTGQGSVGDVRRLFYLCRDQMKIMRASFGDLDSPRLAEDEELRLHGGDLLRSKWWGAQHAYLSDARKVKCGHFYEGPITERCVEFAEYDSNLYCLANLLASGTADGEFTIDLSKDFVPGCTLATACANTSDEAHEKIAKLFHVDAAANGTPDSYLTQLVKTSLQRAYNLQSNDLEGRSLMGCSRRERKTWIWFVWPSIPNQQLAEDSENTNSETDFLN